MLVVGVTGKTGGRVAAELERRGVPVRGVSRTSAIPFDWDDPHTWPVVLRGVGAAYLATPTVPDLAAAQATAFVSAAVDAGVRRVVLLSGRSATAGSKRMLTLERAVRDSDADWTILRPSVFDQNFSEGNLRDSVRSGVIRQVSTGAAKIDFIDVADVAEVAATALTTDGHLGKTYELSGPRALSYAEAAATIASVTGRDIEVVEVEPTQWAADALAAGVPPEAVEWSLEAADGVRNGFYATPFDDAARILGREPRSFKSFVHAAAAAGAWD